MGKWEIEIKVKMEIKSILENGILEFGFLEFGFLEFGARHFGTHHFGTAALRNLALRNPKPTKEYLPLIINVQHLSIKIPPVLHQCIRRRTADWCSISYHESRHTNRISTS